MRSNVTGGLGDRYWRQKAGCKILERTYGEIASDSSAGRLICESVLFPTTKNFIDALAAEKVDFTFYVLLPHMSVAWEVYLVHTPCEEAEN